MLNKRKDEFVQELNERCDIVYKNAEIMKKLVESLRSTETFKMYKEHLPANAVQTLEQIYNPRRDEVMAKRTTQLWITDLIVLRFCQLYRQRTEYTMPLNQVSSLYMVMVLLY